MFFHDVIIGIGSVILVNGDGVVEHALCSAQSFGIFVLQAVIVQGHLLAAVVVVVVGSSRYHLLLLIVTIIIALDVSTPMHPIIKHHTIQHWSRIIRCEFRCCVHLCGGVGY